VTAHVTDLQRTEFFCLPDARAAATFPSAFHRVDVTFEDRPVYGRGRPCKDGTRRLQGVRYRVRATVTENEDAVAKLREKAGCFVLLTTIPAAEKSGQDILMLY
jgi:hypothetical protein